MNPDVLQFQCSACQSVLTVPSSMAGVTGPCPICGQTITSPSVSQPQAPTAPSLFGSSPPPSPAPSPQPSSLSPGLGRQEPSPVMPMPHSIAQHLTPKGATPPPAGGGFLGGFPPAQPSSSIEPPPWQQPGLGQTLLTGMPQSPAPVEAPPSPPAMGGFNLPPRRPDGQSPQTGSLLPASASPAPWGTPPPPQAAPQAGSPLFPQPRSGGGAPSHSSLIPGSPTLPNLGAGGLQESPLHASLLSRDMPAAAPAPLAKGPPEAVPGFPPSIPQSAAALPGRNTRPLKKPARSSNIFMFSLAVLFLAGFVAAAAWMFREPLTEVVTRFWPHPKEVIAQIPSVPSAENVIPEAPSEPDGKPESPPSPAVTANSGVFNPDAPRSSEAPAQKVTPEEIAALQSTPRPPLTAQPLVAPSGQGLMEVPSKPMTPALQNGNEPATAESLAMPSSKEAPKIEVTEEAKPASEALLKFLNAQDLKERLRHTLAASSMKPIMERYYQAQPDGPVRVDSIGLVRYDPKPQMGGGAHVVFGVESRTWEYPVPVMLEETKDGFQVDWLSFVEFKDRLLEKFFEGYQEGPARFHVGITRTHYFEDKVPNSGNKDAFRISPAPPNPYLTTVFVEKDSQVGRELKDRIPWGSQVWAIVELEWVKLGTQQWVQLAAVPQLNWYSVPTETKSSEAKSKTGRNSGPPDEVQRAVPVGR